VTFGLVALTSWVGAPFPPAAVPSAEAAPAALLAGSRIRWQGEDWYLHGANVPWFNWQCDFGCGSANGASASGVRTALATRFSQARESGIRVLRWWTFEGDPWQVGRDGSGAPTGLNPAVYADFDAALDLADERAMSQQHSSFRTVGSLAEHICQVTA
jgi:hypothetical protein